MPSRAAQPIQAAVRQRTDLTRLFLLGGLAISIALVLVSTVVPVSRARFTSAGRAVVQHRTDVALAGLASFLITVLVYLVVNGQ